jgi:hypothetical protein
MSLSKNPFFAKITTFVIYIYLGKSCPKFWATSVIFITLPKENDHPLGEKLPKLVTLAAATNICLPLNPLSWPPAAASS